MPYRYRSAGTGAQEICICVKREERGSGVTKPGTKISEWKNAYVGVASILAGFYQLAEESIWRIEYVLVRKTTGAGKETEPVVENEKSPA